MSWRATQPNVLLLALLGALAVTVSFWLRVHYPSPGFLAEPAENGWRVTHIVRGAAQGGLPPSWIGVTLTQACAADTRSRCVTLEPAWMSDGPTLPPASGIAHFVQSQQALWQLTSSVGQQVVFHAQSANGQSLVPATVTMHPAREFMTERYGLMLFMAIAVYSIGCALLAYVRRTRQVWLAFAMCAGYFLYMLARGWYTSRSWAQPETSWWLAIYGFRLGVLCCGTATVFTLWNVRFRGRHTWLPLSICGVIALVVLAHSLHWIESSAWGYRIPTLGYFLIVAGISLHGWLSSPASPGDRLRARAFDLILLIGFAPLMVTMPLWTFWPATPDIIYLHNAALGLAAIPGVVILARSNYYHLHDLWWRLWLVLGAAGLALVGTAMLMLTSSLSIGVSLLLMLGLSSGMVYLLRDWLEKRLVGTPPTIDQFLPQLLGLQTMQGPGLEQAWSALLVSVFSPKSIAPCLETESPQRVMMLSNGDCLVVPALRSTRALNIVGAAQFTRCFSWRDVELVSSMHALALQGLTSHAAFVAGMTQERLRIAADLHDDIGGKLLHLASVGGEEGRYARHTLEDLRTITHGLSQQARTLSELLADTQYQLRQRAERASIELQWQVQLSPPDEATLIGPQQCALLVSICSELMRNALQHQEVSEITFLLRTANQHITLECSNDGAQTEPAHWIAGLGTVSVRRRIHDLQGQCTWEAQPAGGVLFTASWSLANWSLTTAQGQLPATFMRFTNIDPTVLAP